MHLGIGKHRIQIKKHIRLALFEASLVCSILVFFPTNSNLFVRSLATKNLILLREHTLHLVVVVKRNMTIHNMSVSMRAGFEGKWDICPSYLAYLWPMCWKVLAWCLGCGRPLLPNLEQVVIL
jgi:hypothetical protein